MKHMASSSGGGDKNKALITDFFKRKSKPGRPRKIARKGTSGAGRPKSAQTEEESDDAIDDDEDEGLEAAQQDVKVDLLHSL